MRIVFIDFIRWDYVVDSAYRRPLGGSQSALCYLAEALAALGHEVYLLSNTLKPVLSRGVQCLPIRKMPPNFFATFDAAIVLNGPAAGLDVRGWLRPERNLFFGRNTPTISPRCRCCVTGPWWGRLMPWHL